MSAERQSTSGETEPRTSQDPDGRPEGTRTDGTRTSGDSRPEPARTAGDEDRWSHFAPATPGTPGRMRRAAAGAGRFLVHEWTLASLGGVVLAVLMTWPTMLHPTRTLPEDIWDPALLTWALAWSGHIMRTDPGQLWNANAFFPEPNSYAFTDTLLGYFPAGMIGSGPAAAIFRYNVIFVLAFALAFVGGYALLRQLGATKTGALLAGAAVAFAPWRWGQSGHLHVLSTGGMFLALAMLARGHGYSLRHGRRPELEKPRWAVAGWLVAAWQVSLGFGIGLVFAYLLGALALASAVIMLVRRATAHRRLPRGRLLLADAVGMLAFVGVGAFMAHAYLVVAADHPYAKRTAAELDFFSPPLRGFFTAPPESLPWGGLHDAARAALPFKPEMALLPGFMLYALALTGLFFSIWRLRVRLWLLAGLLAATALGLGTWLFGGRFSYLPLLHHVPGFEALRTPGRMIVWITLLLAVLAAGAVSALVGRAFEMTADRVPYRPGPLLRLVTLVPVLLVLAEGTNQMPHPVFPGQPAALRTVAGPMLVLPTDPLVDENVMVWSTTRFQRMVNGGSGFTPRSQEQTREVARAFPDPASVDHLRQLGVRTVVVLKDRVRGTPYERALTDPGTGLGLTRQDRGDTIVFDLGGR